MYNFGIFLANQAATEYEKKKKKPGNKYRYSIDFSAALRKAKDYFLRRPDRKPVDIIRLLCRFIYAVKEEYRQFARPLRGISAIHFNYR